MEYLKLQSASMMKSVTEIHEHLHKIIFNEIEQTERENFSKFLKVAFDSWKNDQYKCSVRRNEGHGGDDYDDDEEKALKSFCLLTKILLKHELSIQNVSCYRWTGAFAYISSQLLILYAKLHELDDLKMNIAKWLAFAEVHKEFPLDVQVFNDILTHVIEDSAAMDGYITTDGFLRGALARISMSSRTQREPPVVSVKLKTDDKLLVGMFMRGAKTFMECLTNFNSDHLKKTIELVTTLRKLKCEDHGVDFNLDIQLGEAFKDAFVNDAMVKLNNVVEENHWKRLSSRRTVIQSITITIRYVVSVFSKTLFDLDAIVTK